MKISIITATYNSEKTIKDTLDSVLSQTFDDFEHIIIDGGSKDSTMEIVKSYEKKYHGRLKYISEKDKGLYDAMNKGICLATGDVVGILNSDDVYYDKDSLSKIANAFPSSDICFGDLVYMNEDLSKVMRTWRTKLGKFERGWIPAHPTFYVKKKVYEEKGNYNLDFKICADYDFMIRALKDKKYKIAYIDDFLVKMRLGGKSSDGLKGYAKNALEANRVLKHNKIHFSELIILRRIFTTLFQYIKK